MNRYFLLFMCMIGFVFAKAQDDSKYLAGAVPEENERVVFTKLIKTKTPISDTDLYDLMTKWANTNYSNKDIEDKHDELTNRVLVANDEKKSIICYGEMLFIFRNNLFVYDRAKMKYQLIMNIEPGICNAIVKSIKFDYGDDKNMFAEELITDKYALNGKGDGLNRYYDKFRIRTVDSVAQIFNSIDVYLNGKTVVMPATTPGAVATISKPAAPAKAMEGYKALTADKIPDRLVNEWVLVSSGASKQAHVVPAVWSGSGTLFDKDVAYSSLDTKRYPVDVIDKGDTYTISFYTEIYKDAIKEFNSTKGSVADKVKKSGLTPIQTPSGATAFSEAWLIIECKKAGVQSVSQEDKDKEGFNQSYIGEILNIWAK